MSRSVAAISAGPAGGAGAAQVVGACAAGQFSMRVHDSLIGAVMARDPAGGY
ncbi:hypothetical protein [Streptomyces sp. NPDC051657]|uniref:hypothetical protein n=1 Tax=unclassified Streptomyces TaxID=2593676 RepID=UPI00342C0539